MQVFTAEDIEVSGVTSVEMISQKMSALAGFAGSQSNAYWTDANTDTMTYDLLCRQLYVKVRYSF